MNKSEITNIIAFGTLREDILLRYDFSVPLEKMEVKLDSYKSVIGGSVYNSCLFLSNYSKTIDITLLVPNCQMQLSTLFYEQYPNLHIIYNGSNMASHPLSIIGICKDGEKRIISCDNAANSDGLLNIVSKYISNCQLLYTSFYEINKDNYIRIAHIFSEINKTGKLVMLDLCPLLNTFSKHLITNILEFVSVLSGNELEYQALFNILKMKSAEAIFKKFKHINVLCIKQGEHGATILKRTTSNYKKPYEKYEHVIKEKIVAKNTVGCGDVFNAVIINGLINNKSLRHILDEAVEESRKIALGGLPWMQK